MGTNKGIIKYDPLTRTNEWFASVSGNVLNIVGNDTGWVWYSSKNEIGRLNRLTRKWKHSPLMPCCRMLLSWPGP